MNQIESKVSIEEIQLGTGAEAIKGALVLVNYIGTLNSGEIFDSTEKHGRSFQFVVGSKKIIQGMSLGVLGMRVGGKRKIHIPSELAYGDRQIGNLIKANSDLNFEIELLESLHRED